MGERLLPSRVDAWDPARARLHLRDPRRSHIAVPGGSHRGLVEPRGHQRGAWSSPSSSQGRSRSCAPWEAVACVRASLPTTTDKGCALVNSWTSSTDATESFSNRVRPSSPASMSKVRPGRVFGWLVGGGPRKLLPLRAGRAILRLERPDAVPTVLTDPSVCELAEECLHRASEQLRVDAYQDSSRNLRVPFCLEWWEAASKRLCRRATLRSMLGGTTA